MDFHLDVTPVTEPTFFQSFADDGRTPIAERRIGPAPSPERRKQVSISPTDAVVLKPFEIARHDTRTQTGAKKSSTAATGVKPLQIAGASQLVVAREARLALLAKKYEGEPTVEDSARLALLTERIRRLQPRVTKRDVDVLTQVVGQVEQVTDSLAQMRQRLGIA